MEQDITDIVELDSTKTIKTYSSLSKNLANKEHENKDKQINNNVPITREPLTTKNAVKFLLEGTLNSKVCRGCMNISNVLYDLDQVFHIAGHSALYKVTVRDMVAAFYPFKIINDKNHPNRMCEKCLNRTISSYLFTQQLEQSDRAFRNCFEDISEKFNKLDPLDPPKKRGRQKFIINHNVINVEHPNVIDYADPIYNLINIGSEAMADQAGFFDFECNKCAQVLPNLESLMNHEKIHPKSMWYNCRLCGKSFAKINQLKRHIKGHTDGQPPKPVPNTFVCNTCGYNSDVYVNYLQHIEKHKFKTVMEHVVGRKTDSLCTVCLDNGEGEEMVDLNQTVSLHGGIPELTGERSLYNILGSTLPDMNILHNHTGTKICEKCLNHAITCYIFTNEFHFVRNRLNTCISAMLDNLNELGEPKANVFVEINENSIMPIKDDYDYTQFTNDEDIDETKLKVDVLEDEFRLQSDSENESVKSVDISSEIIDNPAKNVTRTYGKKRVFNGYQSKNYDAVDQVSEFLTFNKRKPKKTKKFRLTCPLCGKHFITQYFLKRHVLKHVQGKVQCVRCSEHFKSKFYLYEHVKMVHLLGAEQFSSCSTCGRAYTNATKLLIHERSHYNKQCVLCDKMFIDQSHYETHMQKHALKVTNSKRKRRGQTCSFCEKEYANDNELTLHVNKLHLQMKPYSCDMCDRQFYTEYNMGSHKKIHNMFSREVCEFCNKTLNCRRQLVVHVRKHIGIAPYNCQKCKQSFYSQNKVKKHMKHYHGGRFFCKFCTKVFANKSRLNEHVNTAHFM